MSSQAPARRSVMVVGAGMVGLGCAWLLQRRGHRVLLVDGAQGGGSAAALGVFMAQVFHRGSGRGWRLRQQSLALWREWRQELASRGRRIPWRDGLLLLAADDQETERLQRLREERRRQGIALDWWPPARLEALTPSPPGAAVGGLHSPLDGQLDPREAMEALHSDARAHGLTHRAETVVALERRSPPGGGWRAVVASGGRLEAQWVVLCPGVDTGALLRSSGGDWAPGEGVAVEPVLGQALELELANPVAAGAWTWPGALVWRGMNLVPRPDLPGGRRLWLGATLEPGREADPRALTHLRSLGGDGPEWLLAATERRRWHGLRARPVGRPAPLLEVLSPGLLLASGHYRNGILLAPATAQWVVEQVEAGEDG
ncbi:MAG: FAD-dependent oxidoreductase [Cyanobacteriota bacterium]|nr:FAD-dependent oxidoreductase [Cyanobacteriota bacterium]